MISNKRVKEILQKIGWNTIIEAIRETFIEEANGETDSPAKLIMHLENNNDYRVMPSRMFKYPYIGTKIIAACGSNYKVNKPLARGVYVLNTMECQDTVMFCEAEELTAYRTAAATAVAVDALAKKDSTILGIVGCGKQALYHIEAICAVRNIDTILLSDTNLLPIYSLKDKTDYNPLKIEVLISNTNEILKYTDIAVTLTPTRKPHIFVNDVKFDREMLICAVGGDSDKKIEIHEEVLPLVDHFSDSYDQVLHTGMVHNALEDGIITPNDLKSLGGYLTGKLKTDNSKNIKMFLSTGVALEDLALARLIYENEKDGKGDLL